jgi:large subunit ribosomal protein L31
MKKAIHPDDYRMVVFQDEAAKFAFLTRSTAKSTETIKWTDGKEYPLIKMHISSASHPFFTGEEKIIDVEGRVDRFAAKLKAAAQHKKELAERSAKKAAEQAKKSAAAAAKKVQENAADLKEKVQDAAEKVADKAKDEAKDLAGKAKAAVAAGAEKVETAAKKVEKAAKK